MGIFSNKKVQPAGAEEVNQNGEETQVVKKKKKKKIKKKKKSDAHEWTETLDVATGIPYYTNSVSGEVSWDVPASWDNDGEDGALFTSTKRRKYDPETGEGYFLDLFGEEGKYWKEQVLKSFYENTPRCVSSIDGDAGKRIVFPGVFPVSPLVRITICETLSPSRHRITVSVGNPEDEANNVWQPVHYIYGFACEMPYTLPYFIENRREPSGCRLKQKKNPQERDFANWRRKNPPMGFFAFPEPLPGSSTYFLDWSSGPDRYVISNEPAPQLGWLRSLRFNAYTALKYHCLEAPPVAGGWVPRYRVHRGHWCPLQVEWKCLFAFFAFESQQVPGTSRYYMQQRFEPHFSTRIAKEPSAVQGWKDYGSFCAFDVPMPGTARFSVDFLTADTDSREGPTEVSRVYAKDTWEPWVEKIFFYAFPAPTLLFPPNTIDEDDDDQTHISLEDNDENSSQAGLSIHTEN